MGDAAYIGSGMALRVGELFLKGGNRRIFERALLRNVQRALAGREDVTVRPAHGRIFVLGNADGEVAARLRNVFGASSLSPVVFTEKSMEALTAAALELAERRPPGARTFRISARRSDKSFPARSNDINRIIGAAVAVRTGLTVDLEEADFDIGIEVGPAWCFAWSERIPGAGGLPVGTGGRALLLLSGGIDSPVAGHLMQKRGVELQAVFFHSFPYTGDAARDKVVRLAARLAERQGSLRLHTVPFAKVQEALRDGAPAASLVVLYRRAMIRIAEAIAAREHLAALVTGESLGQVASQTLANMAAIGDAARLPVLRPLVGFDKAETIALAQRIGTFEISILPHDDCCSLFVPKHPETKASLRRIRTLEARIDAQARLDEALASAAAQDL